MEARIVFLHALTPVHAGTGQTMAVIDLPIAREKATGWPILPSSSIKGVLRDRAEAKDADWLFGKQDEAGALCFSDQRLLLFPAKSLFGTFAWTTCPLALRRLVRDWAAFGLEPPFRSVPDVRETTLLHPTGSVLVGDGGVYLEDLDLRPKTDPTVEQIAQALSDLLFVTADEKKLFIERFALVSDDIFTFLCETSTEVQARVRLKKETKTVEPGGLWYEEAAPAESVFVGGVLVSDHVARGQDPRAALETLSNQVVQIGGKSTVGRGLCRLVVA